MKIATYNVNSINARIENLLDFLRVETPDVVLLQEIKTEFNTFPFFELMSAGYDAKILGQKSYNGVAILSRHKINVVCENMPEFYDENSRYLEADVFINNKKLRIASIYLPNGNPPYNNPDDDSKYVYKIKFMDALLSHAKKLLGQEENVVLGGDFNVIFKDDDVYNPELFKNNALCREEVRERFAGLIYSGFYDAFKVLKQKENGYTYWDYGGGAFAADLGMRIDYLMLSPMMADKIESCRVSKTTRAGAKPSDHAPLISEFRGF